MKTLRLAYINGRYDLVMQNGKATVLDSANPAQKKEMLQQRFEKIMRSKPNFFDPDYGGNINSVIGAKKSVSIALLSQVFERINNWFRKNDSGIGNAAIRGVRVAAISEGRVDAVVYGAESQVPVTLDNK
jgi:hypothetical protein